MGSDIERVIERLFPEGLEMPEAFDTWVSLIRADIQPDATDLVARLERALSSAKQDSRNSSSLCRDGWELFGGDGERTIKSVGSIRSKLARDLMGAPGVTINSPRLSETELRQQVMTFSDLGRIRIVADFPSDIDFLITSLFQNKKFLGCYDCPNGVKDFIFDPGRRDGLKGHRALQFSVRVPVMREESFGFEVQLMTRLQHAWDRRNHPLYEWQREHLDWSHDGEAVKLAVNDFACAEALHLVDRQADANWKRLQELLMKEKTI